MYNFTDHEANLPSDKASYKVLYNDYFHDSPITSVCFNPIKHIFEIHLQCSRECEEETGNWRKNIYNEKYGYVLTFSGVTYLDIKTDLQCPDYINGRFKNIPKGKYYFRIQIADGQIDIAYRSFKLRKLVGRVSYCGITEFDPWLDRAHIVSQDQIDAIMQRLEDDGYTEDKEFELFLDLERLYASKVPGLASYLRRCIALPWDIGQNEAIPYAAWLLGKYGNADDIPLISQLMKKTNDYRILQNLHDAISALSDV